LSVTEKQKNETERICNPSSDEKCKGDVFPSALLQKHKHYISMELNIRASFQNNCTNHRM
jgi:hypothetical protein